MQEDAPIIVRAASSREISLFRNFRAVIIQGWGVMNILISVFTTWQHILLNFSFEGTFPACSSFVRSILLILGLRCKMVLDCWECENRSGSLYNCCEWSCILWCSGAVGNIIDSLPLWIIFITEHLLVVNHSHLPQPLEDSLPDA